MKHPIKLIILFIISASYAVFNLIVSYFNYDTLEEDVSMAMTNMFKNMPDINPEDIPEFIFVDLSSSISHYMDYGVAHYYIEFWSYALAFIGVIMMASFKKSGFTLYALGKLLGFAAIFIGYGFNSVIAITALIYAALAFLFIRLYQVWFLKNQLETSV